MSPIPVPNIGHGEDSYCQHHVVGPGGWLCVDAAQDLSGQ